MGDMEDYITLCELIRDSSTDVVLEYIRSKNINAETFAEFSYRSLQIRFATNHRHRFVMDELISRCFDSITSSLTTNTCFDLHPLHLACLYNRLDIILSLHRDHGIDINSVHFQSDTTLVFVLDNCSEKALYDVVKTLVEAGASVNIPCHIDGRTPLSAAIDRHNIDVCRYLILTGADVNARYNNVTDETYVVHALKCYRVDIDIVRLFVESGADVNATDKKQKSALMYAIDNNAGIEILRLLLDYGADVNALDERNKSPLCYALVDTWYLSKCKTTEDIVKLLVKSGADVNALDINQISPLMYALRTTESLEVTKLLVESGADVNALDINRKPVLLYAMDTHADNMEANVKMLIESGADVNVLDNDMLSPLIHSVRDFHINICVTRLLVDSGADVNAADKERKSVLMHAIDNNAGIEILQLLLDYGADVNALDERNKSPLCYALVDNWIPWEMTEEIVELLVKSGADVKVVDNNQVSPLVYALDRIGNSDIIGLLVKSGANVNALDNNNKSPLCHAMNTYWEANVKVLIESGADVNVFDNNISPLIFAVKNNAMDMSMIRLLVESGADVNAADSERKTSLMHAIENRAGTEVIEFLVESGAEVNVLDANNKSPVCYAIETHELDTKLNVLVNAEADVNVLDNDLVSPLMLALSKGIDIELCRLLVEAGADVNAFDKDKKSPLHYALETYTHNTGNIVAHLIESGADVNALDINNASPLMYALKQKPSFNEKNGVVSLLLNSGANVNIVDKNHKTPLHYAIGNTGCDNQKPLFHYDTGRDVMIIDVLQMLVDSGADVNFQDKNGDSPLMYELKNYPSVKVMRLFLERGVDVCARNQDNISPLGFFLGSLYQFRTISKEEGGLINLVEMFAKLSGDLKGQAVTLPYTTLTHDDFDVIRRLSSKGVTIKGLPDNSIFDHVMNRITRCCCAKCFNLVHYIIIQLNLSPWGRNSINKTLFRCGLELKKYYAKETHFRQDIADKILQLCLQAGYTPNVKEMSIVRQIEEESSTVIKGSDVTSLQDICCFSVRRALGRRLPTAVNSLPIPEKLKQRVQLTQVETMVETPENTVESRRHYDDDDDIDEEYYYYDDDHHDVYYDDYCDYDYDEHHHHYEVYYDDYCDYIGYHEMHSL